MRERKKNRGSGAAAAVVLVLALLGQIAEGEGAFILVPLLTLAVVAGVGLILGRKYKKAAPVFMPKKQEPCEFGKANHDYSHDASRRLVQLAGFYQDGLIDRKAYELLRQRWSKN